MTSVGSRAQPGIGSQSAGDLDHLPSGMLPLLSPPATTHCLMAGTKLYRGTWV